MKVAIIYYSTYGHVVAMAKAIQAGVQKSGKASQADIFQVPETLDQSVLAKLGAPPKAEFPVATVEVLEKYDAFVFGYPTRFGTLPAQLVDFLGQTSGLWVSGGLYGKPVALFTSVSSPGGGQEATLRNFFSYVAHHGMVYVPLGYGKAFPYLSNLEEVHGGTPYGAVCFSGADGSRQPSKLELTIAEVQGETFATTAVKFSKTLAPKQAAGAAGAAGAGAAGAAGASAAKGAESKSAAPAAAKAAPKAAEREEKETAKRAEQLQPAPEEKESGCGVKCAIV